MQLSLETIKDLLQPDKKYFLALLEERFL